MSISKKDIEKLIDEYEAVSAEIRTLNEDKKKVGEKLMSLIKDGERYGHWQAKLKHYPEGYKHFSWSRASKELSSAMIKKMEPFLTIKEKWEMGFKRLSDG